MGNCLPKEAIRRALVVNNIHTTIEMPPECTVEEVRRILMQKWRLEALCVGSKERKLGQGCHRTVFYTFPFYKAIVVEADFQRKPFECPISLEIMVDPVLCSDGFVYERVSIESHIQTRQDMEAKRLDGDEQDEEEDETHCGSPRGVIHVTSPCTNEELTSLELSPLFDLQRIIFILINDATNPLDLTKSSMTGKVDTNLRRTVQESRSWIQRGRLMIGLS